MAGPRLGPLTGPGALILTGTPDRAAYFNSDGELVASDVTIDELNALDGYSGAALETRFTDIETLADGAIYIGNASNEITEVTPSGDVTISNTGVTAITADTIVDTDINSAAAIVRSKLASGTANRVAVNDGSGVLSDADAITGDRALVSDADGIPTHTAVTTTEIGYVSGVTSAIQDQIDGKQASDATLAALAAYNTNGLLTQTAADTFAGRTITAGSTKISVSNGDGVAGNPTLDVSEADLTLDSIGGTLGIAKGGTGQTSQTAAMDALSPTTTKGDLLVDNGTNVIRLAVGTDGQALVADSGQASGLIWTTPATTPDQSYELTNLSLAASVAADALTIALKDKSGSDPSGGSPVKVGFRNATAATGTYTQISITSALSLTVPSGASLGHTSAMNQYVWVYLINNAGTAELAVSGVKLFDDYSIASSTTIGAGSTSGTVMYSATGRSNVAIRLIGRLLSSQATAGTWATAIAEVASVHGKQPVTTTDPESWTPTGNWSTNTTWTGTKWRTGALGHYIAKAALGGAPDAASFTVTMPSGEAISTSFLTHGNTPTRTRLIGSGSIDDASGSGYVIEPRYVNTTSVGASVQDGTTNNPISTVNASGSTPIAFTTNDSVILYWSVPIVGWSTYGP